MFKVLIQLACISFGGDPGWDDPVSFFFMESSILYLVDMDKFILVFLFGTSDETEWDERCPSHH